MNPAEIFQNRVIQRLGEFQYHMMRVETERDLVTNELNQLKAENEKNGNQSPTKSPSQVQLQAGAS